MDTGKGWVYMPRNGPEYREGVNKFIKSSLNTLALKGRIKCPCKRCALTVYLDPKDVCEHLFCEGFDKNYANSVWVFHGEEPSPSRLEDEIFSDVESNEGVDDMYGLLHDAFGFPSLNVNTDESPQVDEGEMNLVAQKFHKLMQDAKTELYPGCDKYTTLSFILRLHQMKSLHRWSDTSVNDMLQFLNDFLPTGSNLWYVKKGSFRRRNGDVEERGSPKAI